MKRFILFILLLQSTLTAAIPIEGNFQGPTEQLIKRETWKKIDKNLGKMKIPKDLYPFFNEISAYEDWGHIGYHGANQGYRIYQDIIKIVVEEILTLPIREDFHFLRIPGDSELNLNSLLEFSKFHRGEIDNKTDLRAKQLMSLNFAVYSNYDNQGSCSISLFVKDKSKDNINYINQLSPFFKELGISPEALKDLFAIAQSWFNEDGGILLQISENSHLNNPYNLAFNFADEQCYPAKRGGYKYGSSSFSNHIERIMTDLYLDHKLDIAPQLRILINNSYTLNPHSHLNIRRFDLYDSETVTLYEEDLREYIKTLNFDPVKAANYRQNLINQWN